MYNDIIINGLPIVVSGIDIAIFDPLHDVTPREAEMIASYLYSEGFIESDHANYTIFRDEV